MPPGSIVWCLPGRGFSLTNFSFHRFSTRVGLSFSELVFPRTSGPEITSNVRIEILMVRHAAEKSERRVFRLVRTARVLRTTSLLL